VLDLFGFEDIFLNQERSFMVICEAPSGGELLVISKHSFITSILCHSSIKNYLLQKMKSDAIRPQRFIDDRPVLFVREDH